MSVRRSFLQTQSLGLLVQFQLWTRRINPSCHKLHFGNHIPYKRGNTTIQVAMITSSVPLHFEACRDERLAWPHSRSDVQCPHWTHMGSMLGGNSLGVDLCLVPADSLEQPPHAACNSHTLPIHIPSWCQVCAQW